MFKVDLPNNCYLHFDKSLRNTFGLLSQLFLRHQAWSENIRIYKYPEKVNVVELTFSKVADYQLVVSLKEKSIIDAFKTNSQN